MPSDVKVENILKGTYPEFNPITFQWKFKSRAGYFAWGVKAKYCWALSTNFWRCIALFPQGNFHANNLNFYWRWWDRIQAIFFYFFLTLPHLYRLHNLNNINLIYPLFSSMWMTLISLWEAWPKNLYQVPWWVQLLAVSWANNFKLQKMLIGSGTKITSHPLLTQKVINLQTFFIAQFTMSPEIVLHNYYVVTKKSQSVGSLI